MSKSSKKSKKIYQSKKIGFVLLLIGLFLAAASLSFVLFRSQPGEIDFRDNYTKAPVNHIYRTVYADEAIEFLNNRTGVMLLGFPQCPWCQGLVPHLDDAAKNSGVKQILYFDVRADRTDNTETYQKIVKVLAPFLEKDEAGEPRVYVPQVVIVKNGKIVGSWRLEFPSDMKNPTPDNFWTEKNIADVKDQLSKQFKKLD